MAKKKAVKRKPRTASKVDAATFCKRWKFAADKGWTVQQLADDLKMEKNAVLARRNNYASALGLKFPKLARANAGPRLDKAELQKILNG